MSIPKRFPWSCSARQTHTLNLRTPSLVPISILIFPRYTTSQSRSKGVLSLFNLHLITHSNCCCLHPHSRFMCTPNDSFVFTNELSFVFVFFLSPLSICLRTVYADQQIFYFEAKWVSYIEANESVISSIKLVGIDFWVTDLRNQNEDAKCRLIRSGCSRCKAWANIIISDVPWSQKHWHNLCLRF